MDLFRTRQILLLISFTFLVGGGIGALLYYVFPEFYPPWFVESLLFLFLYSLVSIFVVCSKVQKIESRKLVNLYMLMKVSKMLLALVYVSIYAIIIQSEIKKFVVIFMLLYVLFLFFDTWFLSRVERRLKESKKEA